MLPFDWRRVLIYTHRWLGIAGGVLFLSWFLSGIVMMYAGMPSLTPEERLMRLPVLDLSSARVAPAEAARGAGLSLQRVLVGMLGDRPVYRFSAGGQWTTVFADSGEVLESLSVKKALEIARHFAPAHATSVSYDARLTDPDQWTLQSLAFMPMHRIGLDDADDTFLYVSERTGEPVMKTTGSGRRWAYAGAVLHWLYFTPLRRHGAFWSQSIIWLSIVGCVLCLSGLVWGVWRLSPKRRYRLKGVHAHSPYASLMKWHHYAGLVFGLVTFTWVFSGGLSMNPWSWHPSMSPTREQREAVSGGALRLDAVTVEGLRAGMAAIASSFVPKELEVVQFRGEPYLVALRPARPGPVNERARSGPIERLLVSAVAPERGAFTRFDADAMLAAARAAMPGTAVDDAVWLEEYDAYYYDRHGARLLPVLRVRYDDPLRTWLYLDPQRGVIVQKEERLSRVNRWLYHGLHSLDFPFLYYRRPLWDVVVIVLSLGGIVLSASTMVQAWRRLRRHARHVARKAGF